jgi:dihydroxy-acid dehydratase
MACVSEAIGLALPGSSGAPAPYLTRDEYAYESGKTVMQALASSLRPRDIVTRKALENAAVIVAATGGSTNGALHLPAIANECGIEFDLHDVGAIFKKTPYIADLKPGGKYVAKDLYEVGGVQIILKTLYEGGFIHGDCMTVNGIHGVGVQVAEQAVVHMTGESGDLVQRKGNLRNWRAICHMSSPAR